MNFIYIFIILFFCVFFELLYDVNKGVKVYDCLNVKKKFNLYKNVE